MNLTAQLPAMRETLRRSRSELGRRRTVIASADRVLITSVVAVFDSIGPLLGPPPAKPTPSPACSTPRWIC